jgi:hypothetical protein
MSNGVTRRLLFPTDAFFSGVIGGFLAFAEVCPVPESFLTSPLFVADFGVIMFPERASHVAKSTGSSECSHRIDSRFDTVFFTTVSVY